jgi:hypothetical protein
MGGREINQVRYCDFLFVVMDGGWIMDGCNGAVSDDDVAETEMSASTRHWLQWGAREVLYAAVGVDCPWIVRCLIVLCVRFVRWTMDAVRPSGGVLRVLCPVTGMEMDVGRGTEWVRHGTRESERVESHAGLRSSVFTETLSLSYLLSPFFSPFLSPLGYSTELYLCSLHLSRVIEKGHRKATQFFRPVHASPTKPIPIHH